MYEFIVNKENGVFHVIIAMPYGHRNDYDDFHKSIYPVKVIDNDYGKIIVACDATTILQQLVLTNLELFDKRQHIDFNYLKDVYVKKVDELLKKSKIYAQKPEYNIIVISEGKAYQIFSDNGYIKEDDRLISTLRVAALYNGTFPEEKEHGKPFLEKIFNLYKLAEKEDVFPALYINTKDYRPIILRRTKL